MDKRANLAPSGVKNWKLLFTNLTQLVYKKTGPSVKFWHLFYFFHCYGNKNGQQNRLKIEKLSFWAKFKAFSDRFIYEFINQHKGITKKPFNICVPW